MSIQVKKFFEILQFERFVCLTTLQQIPKVSTFTRLYKNFSVKWEIPKEPEFSNLLGTIDIWDDPLVLISDTLFHIDVLEIPLSNDFVINVWNLDFDSPHDVLHKTQFADRVFQLNTLKFAKGWFHAHCLHQLTEICFTKGSDHKQIQKVYTYWLELFTPHIERLFINTWVQVCESQDLQAPTMLHTLSNHEHDKEVLESPVKFWTQSRLLELVLYQTRFSISGRQEEIKHTLNNPTFTLGETWGIRCVPENAFQAFPPTWNPDYLKIREKLTISETIICHVPHFWESLLRWYLDHMDDRLAEETHQQLSKWFVKVIWTRSLKFLQKGFLTLADLIDWNVTCLKIARIQSQQGFNPLSNRSRSAFRDPITPAQIMSLTEKHLYQEVFLTQKQDSNDQQKFKLGPKLLLTTLMDNLASVTLKFRPPLSPITLISKVFQNRILLSSVLSKGDKDMRLLWKSLATTLDRVPKYSNACTLSWVWVASPLYSNFWNFHTKFEQSDRHAWIIAFTKVWAAIPPRMQSKWKKGFLALPCIKKSPELFAIWASIAANAVSTVQTYEKRLIHWGKLCEVSIKELFANLHLDSKLVFHHLICEWTLKLANHQIQWGTFTAYGGQVIGFLALWFPKQHTTVNNYWMDMKMKLKKQFKTTISIHKKSGVNVGDIYMNIQTVKYFLHNDPHYGKNLLFIMLLGLRTGSVTNLNRACVYPDPVCCILQPPTNKCRKAQTVEDTIQQWSIPYMNGCLNMLDFARHFIRNTDEENQWLFPALRLNPTKWVNKYCDAYQRISGSKFPGDRKTPYLFRHMAASFAKAAGIPAQYVDGLLGHAAGIKLSTVLNPFERRKYSSLQAYLKSYASNKVQSLNDNFWIVYNAWWTTQLLGTPPSFDICSCILSQQQFDELQVLGDDNRL